MQSESLTIDGMEILENLEQTDQFIDENPFVLLYLSRLDCGVCKSLRPRVSTMMESFENSRTAYIDLDRMPEATGRFSVFTVQAMLLFVQGKETIREARYVSVEELAGRIHRYYDLLFS